MTGTFTDSRDGNTYKTVEINGQVWLAENLRYKGVEHYAPNGDENNIAKYGLLYTWDNAIRACPEGWHLPSKEELEALINFVCNDPVTGSKNLRAESFANGKDLHGFGALPAGYNPCFFEDYDNGNYYHFGSAAYFWSSTEDGSSYAYLLSVNGSHTCIDCFDKTCGFSVRFIKN